MVEQRSLTMVYVSHDRHDRSAGHEIALVVLLLANSLLHFGADILRLESELISHEVDGLRIESLVDRGHDTNAHQCADELVDGNIHHGSQLRHRNKLGELQHLALLALLTCLCVELLLHSLTLFLTILGTALVVVLLAGQTSQRLLYLTCYILLVHLKRLLAAVVLLLALLIVIVVAGIVVAAVVSVAVVLLSDGVDVHALLVDALTLLAVSSVGTVLSLGLTLLSALLLRLLTGSCALVDGREVNLTQDVHLGGIENLPLAAQLEHARFLLLLSGLSVLLSLLRSSLLFGSLLLGVVLTCCLCRNVGLRSLGGLGRSGSSLLCGLGGFRLLHGFLRLNHLGGLSLLGRLHLGSLCLGGHLLRSCAHRLLGNDFLGLATDGSSLGLLFLNRLRSSRADPDRFLAQVVKVYFAQWLVLLVACSLQHTL